MRFILTFILVYLLSLNGIAQVNLTQGLVAYYPFNGNANDASGNNINGVVNGATLTTDGRGNSNSAYNFDGTSSYISLPFNSKYDFAPTDSFSISTWVQPFTNTIYAASAIVVKSPFNSNYFLSAWNYGLYTVNNKAMTGWAGNNFLNASTAMQPDKCWYHLVVTYKNGIWYLYVNGNIEAQDLSQTHFIIQDGPNSTIAFGRKGEASGDYYKGKMDEVRIYNRNLNSTEVKALFNLAATKPEFTFAQDICNLKQITLKNETTNYTKFYWNFGNGTIDSSTIQPVINYNSYGNYNISLITRNSYGCFDTTTKTVPINVVYDSNLIVNGIDTTICSGSAINLYAKDTGLAYCWHTNNGSIINNTTNQTLPPSANTIYYLNSKLLGNNLIVNGDFEQGNTGFTSSYTYQPPPNTTEGVYYVGTNPQVWNGGASACTNHTPSGNKMMMINGSPVANIEIWKETISVTPNTNYAFSAWLSSIYSTNPAQLKYSINDIQIGQLLQSSATTCQWNQFYVTWNSGNNTTATISIVNQNTQVQGNDFALDDISFAPIFIKIDSINVKVNNCPQPNASFSAPDTVCVNQKIIINNTSSNATTYNWNFCDVGYNANVSGVNLGNIGGNFSVPVFMDYVQDNGNYYGFVFNFNPGGITRLDFGNSLLNTPTAVFLGNPNSVLWSGAGGEDIKLVKQNGNWIAIIVGGSNVTGTGPKIVKLDFGTNITNTNPATTDWGNIGVLDQPHQLHLWQENSIWYGILFNAESNTISRINFTNSFNNKPTGVNLGNFGNLNWPSSFQVINDNGIQRIFVSNTKDHSISRLDFGTTLLNTPTGINLGNPNNVLSWPRGIQIYNNCGEVYAYVCNQSGHDISKLNFNGSLLNVPTGVSLGNIGSLNGPHSFSKEFVVGNDKYIFIPNTGTNTLSLFKIAGCTNSSIPNSSLQTPPQISYNTIGTYNITLTIDEGLPTQNSFCKQVIVKNCPINPCQSWLKTPSFPSAVEVGQINIVGDKLTIEAQFNRISGYDNTNPNNSEGDIVSKHDNPTNVNYLLRPNAASITTTNGFYQTPTICDIDTQKTYHVAMVYDGSMLKFYRNGFLMSSINATGNLIQNSWATRIGLYASQFWKENLIGYINEVRIWNIDKSQQQIRQYMNDTLPNPTTQLGLLAYYTFNSLKNKQGNVTFDGTLIGSASINETNPQCKYVVDSCGMIPTPQPNPNCQGVVKLTKTSKITPPSPIKNYFPNTGFTWELWFNSSYYNNSSTTSDSRCKIISVLDVPQCQDIVLGFGWPQVAQQKELCFVADGPNGCADRDNTPCKYFPTGGFVPNTWYHVAAVRDYANNVSNLYVNGILVDTKANTHGAINPTLLPFFGIGSYTSLIDSAFAGKLDEVRFWNYPRSATQIQNNYDKCLNANETGLVAYYHNNEGKGTALKDASPNANDASLSASVTWDKTDNAPLTTTCYQSTYSTINKTICNKDSFQHHTTTGTYNDTTINSTGCDSVTVLHLTVLPATVTTKDTVSGCGSVVINSVSYTTNQLVSITVKNSLGCDSIIQQHQIIITTNLHPQLQQDTSICDGDFVKLYPGNFKTYLWNTGSISSSIKVKNIGLYWVEVSDSASCKGRDSFILINTFAKPSNFLSNNLQVCLGELYTVNGYTNYNWITGETTPSIALNGLSSYWLQVTDNNGCSGLDTMKVVYSGSINSNTANTFSPNGDGINDEFKPFTGSCIINFKMYIFNRWGQKVFETASVNKGWNGMMNNKPLPTDVYYYITNYRTTTGANETKSGSITLLR